MFNPAPPPLPPSDHLLTTLLLPSVEIVPREFLWLDRRLLVNCLHFPVQHSQGLCKDRFVTVGATCRTQLPKSELQIFHLHSQFVCCSSSVSYLSPHGRKIKTELTRSCPGIFLGNVCEVPIDAGGFHLLASLCFVFGCHNNRKGIGEVSQ